MLKEPAALPHQLAPGQSPQSSRFRWCFVKRKVSRQCGEPLWAYSKHFVKLEIFLAETFLAASHLILGERTSH